MHPELVVGPWSFNTYWAVVHLSFLLVVIYTCYIWIRVEHLPAWKGLVFCVLLFAAQFLGGCVVPFIYNWSFTGVLPEPFYQPWRTGRYFHSALMGTLLFFIFYVKSIKRSVPRFLDYFAIGACIMSAVDRIGCFFQGCCGGKATTCFFGVQFPNHTERIHPTQLYHVFFEGLILLPFLLRLQKKKRFEGETFWAYFFIYSVFRFLIEFLRTNPVVWLGLTHAQIFSILMAVVSGAVWRRGILKSRLKESAGPAVLKGGSDGV